MVLRRRAGFVVALVVGLAVVGGAAGALAGPEAPADDLLSRRRTLVISVPGLTWEDVNDASLPNLRAILDESAVANVSLRVTSLATPASEGYATLGAGTRAVADRSIAGLAYGVDEPFGRTTAGVEFLRQTGLEPTGAIVSLSFTRLARQNSGSDYEADLGLLGQALSDAGIDRGVVANADVDEPLAFLDAPHREAALSLVDELGEVPCGDVSQALLVDEPGAPFGVQLDHDVVLGVVERCSTPGSVVLVEASDLRRAASYQSRLSSLTADVARNLVLARMDELVGTLAPRLDPERDALVIIAPALVVNTPRLAVLGIRAPEYPPGLLVSGSTRQAGYVTLADVTPTIAALAGAPIDEGALEGRAVEVVGEDSTAVQRRTQLEDAESAARFRDRMLAPVAAIFITGVSVLGLAAMALLWRQRELPRGFELAALCLLGVPVMTYLAALFPFHEWGPAPYDAFVFGGGALLGLLYWSQRGSELRPLALGYGALVSVVAVSVVFLDSRLQLSTVFGDSPIIAGRFNGINNVTFSQMMIAAIGLAIIAVRTWEGRKGQVIMVAVLAGVLVVDVAPMWGADVGGILAGLPALAIVGAGLTDRRIRWRSVVIWAGVTVVAVVALGLLDLSRPSADRSHLGRLFERIGSEGFDGFVTVVDRKLSANLRSLGSSVWRFILAPVLLGVVVLVLKAPGRLVALRERLPELAKVLPGVGAAAVLGFALNDSGIAVPGMMLAVVVPSVVYLLARTPTPSEAAR